jgi:hypothetical protein
MVALTTGRATAIRAGADFVEPVAAGVTIQQGSIVCLNAAGFAVPGSAAATLVARGMAKDTVTNAAANGAVSVEIERGELYRFANSAAADLIARTEIGKDVFIVDDQTLAKTNGGGARSVAGKCQAVDANGVWLQFA